MVLNTTADKFDKIRAFVPETVRAVAENGLDRSALHACIERFAFNCREVTEPYGVELAIKSLDCLLAVGDEELIKIHFHTNEPWKVLEYCASLGEIYDIVVEDMDRQERGLKG